MSNSGVTEEDFESLREELERLRIRVDRQGEEIRALQSDRAAASSETASTAFEVVEPASSTGTGTLTWAFRERVAREIGGFLRRSLDGRDRGASGRHQLGDLQSRIYIVVRDIEGNVFNPPRLEDRFFRVRALCQRGNDWGDSIFIGLPSRREALIAVAAAGLLQPSTSR